MALPNQFDLDEFQAYLDARITIDNRKNVMRVARRLVSGQGVTHKAKPGEAFLLGHSLSPKDDIVKIRKLASIWLPYSGKNKLDRGNGWALNHPLTKLIQFKAHLLRQLAFAPSKEEAGGVEV